MMMVKRKRPRPAFWIGYNAMKNRKADSCPFDKPEDQAEWSDGCQKAIDDELSGKRSKSFYVGLGLLAIGLGVGAYGLLNGNDGGTGYAAAASTGFGGGLSARTIFDIASRMVLKETMGGYSNSYPGSQ